MENDFFVKHRDDETSKPSASEGAGNSSDAPAADINSDSGAEVVNTEAVSVITGSTARPIVSTNEGMPPTSTEHGLDVVSTILSWVLVPLNMPLFGLWFLFGLSILTHLPTDVKWKITGIFFCLDIILPMLLVVLLKRLGLVEDLGLNGRKERAIPYLISIAVLAGSGYWCQRLGMPLWIAGFYYGGAMAGAVNLIVNFWWKISAHSAAMAGVLALIARLWSQGEGYGPTEVWLIIWIILTGLLGSARIWLGRHTPMQVFCGSVVGYTAVWFMTGI